MRIVLFFFGKRAFYRVRADAAAVLRTTWREAPDRPRAPATGALGGSGGTGKPRACCRERFVDQRTTSTGSLLWVNTFCVSLPSSSADTPRRPCDAMTIASHFCFLAALRIASH